MQNKNGDFQLFSEKKMEKTTHQTDRNPFTKFSLGFPKNYKFLQAKHWRVNVE